MARLTTGAEARLFGSMLLLRRRGAPVRRGPALASLRDDSNQRDPS